MLTADFDYELPPELIAQAPTVPRDRCRLLVLERTSGCIEHQYFLELTDYLKPADLLVVNDTRVMPSRLFGKKSDSNTNVEVLLLRLIQSDADGRQQLWEALVRPGRRIRPGVRLDFSELIGQVTQWSGEGFGGTRRVMLESTGIQSVSEVLHRIGHIPLPPYIDHYDGDTDLYQTVYAVEENSAAAPTAGLHFSPEMLAQLQSNGISFAAINLAIGLDTFRKVDTEVLEDHLIHSEVYTVSEAVCCAVYRARAAGGRVIAVGTTAVRALESAFNPHNGRLEPQYQKSTSLFITPGYTFNVVDALITNFHTPRSTLMMLVCAFAGRDLIMAAYEEAKRCGYRFLSFGDALFIHTKEVKR
ncbi:MAG: tRNA preQ1(34) S-adenosylmethionine ribosyltransferase-isomerase QueA [Coriobacteriales bacterium]|jgi:S-adenosylmethionine:tRNA ribosyltransferase-isomerase|nr:tRNA preQ1(34) S-adenosylmethionine ribosyltransferase-isomerase QueA [Coriobacteriales bacterium]